MTCFNIYSTLNIKQGPFIHKLPILQRSKKATCMGHLGDFPLIVPCLGWCHDLCRIFEAS